MNQSDAINGIRNLQINLKAIGLYDGAIDGIWGPKSDSALLQLAHTAKTPDAQPAVPIPAGALDARSEANIATLLPSVQAKCRELVAAAAAKGITLQIISGSRTYDEQNEIYAQGRTKPGSIVTNARAGYSWHNFSIAFDVGVFLDSRYIPESPKYKEVGQLGKDIGLEWGGDWTSIDDQPHFQWNPDDVTLAKAREMHDAGLQVA